MKRIVAVVVALGLVVTACGGDDDSGADATADASTEAEESSSEESTTGGTDDTASSEAGEPTADATDEPDDGGDAAGGGGDAVSIRSIDDIPEVCREQMSSFLRQVEPVVSSIDWETATLADFEAIAEDFESLSNEFERDSTVAGCEELDFVDDNEFELMIDFAQDEAPGTVGFLEFLSALGGGATGDAGGNAGGSAGFADCDEAIAFVENLVNTYDSFAEVPAADLLKFSSLATVFVTCSPEQLEYFDSPEVTDFLAG